MSDETVPSVTSSATEDPLLGRTVAGRFQIQELIARGSMGKVYRAIQLPLERPVALKILDIRSDRVSGDGFASRFLREASVLARLNHANTVRVYDYGLWEEHSFLVMEMITGQPLSELIAGGALPPARALNIGVQICGALREAHQQGIIHRDLKPSNVLITQQSGVDFAKLIDFGLGKDMASDGSAELTMVGQILGSPMYMSPEQVRSQDLDQRADIYSLGVVLYRAVTGQRPYLQQGTPALMFAHLNDTPRTFAVASPELRLPPCVEWTVLRCLEKSPEDRFRDASELQRALRACQVALESPSCWDLSLSLSNGTTILPPELSDINADSLVLAPQRLPPPPPPPRSSLPVWVPVVVGLLALLLVGGLYAYSQGATDAPTPAPVPPAPVQVVAPVVLPAAAVRPPEETPSVAPVEEEPEPFIPEPPALPPAAAGVSTRPTPRPERAKPRAEAASTDGVAKPPPVIDPLITPAQGRDDPGVETTSDLKDPWKN